MDYRKEIQELRRTLTENGYLYYVLDAPTMSDYEYDHLLRRLEDLEAAHPEEITPDSPTQRVGGQTLTEFQQVTHAVPQIVEVGDVKVKKLPFLHTVMGDIAILHTKAGTFGAWMFLILTVMPSRCWNWILPGIVWRFLTTPRAGI